MIFRPPDHEPEHPVVHAIPPPSVFEDVHLGAAYRAISLQTIPLAVVGFVICFVAYGAVHVAAWNAQFPTLTDQWMWRGASLVLTGIFWVISLVMLPLVWIIGGIAFLLYAVFVKKVRSLKALLSYAKAFSRGDDLSDRTGKRLFVVVSSLSFGPFLVTYWLARLVLLFEALFSLRSSPPDAYQSVDWSYFLPHLGG